MLTTIEAIIDQEGRVSLLEEFRSTKIKKALVTVLEDNFLSDNIDINTLLSEQSLAVDWNRLEEDEAWAHLQVVK